MDFFGRAAIAAQQMDDKRQKVIGMRVVDRGPGRSLAALQLDRKLALGVVGHGRRGGGVGSFATDTMLRRCRSFAPLAVILQQVIPRRDHWRIAGNSGDAG